MAPRGPQLIALQEAKRAHKISETTLFRWLKQGKLTKYTKPGQGHVTYVDAGELRRLLQPRPVKEGGNLNPPKRRS